MPAKAVDAIKDVRTVTRSYRTDLEFWEGNGRFQQLATVNTSTRIEVDFPTLRGTTTLYGTVIRVGGEDPPRVKLRLLDGQVITCNITRRNNFEAARQLGARLYRSVGVRGQADWDVSDMSLQYFLVEDVVPYTESSLEQALTSLYDLAGSAFREIDDIDAFVSDIRGHGGDM